MRSEGYSSWVCLCVCLSVKSHLTSQMRYRAIKEHAYLVAYKRQKICGDLSETTTFKSYAAKHERKSQYANLPAYPRSAFSTRRTAKAKGYSAIVNNIQPCPKRCLLMLLARVGARTDSTTRAATTRGVANFHARALASLCAVCAKGFPL